MDFELNDVQSDLTDSLRTLLSRHAGPARAREVLHANDCDRALLATLEAAGFLDLATADGAGFLEAAIVVEEVAKHAGVAPVGVRALVAPLLFGSSVPPVMSICEAGVDGPVRYAAAADAILVIDGDSVGVIRPAPGAVKVADSVYGHAMGYVPPDQVEPLGSASGSVARQWWRVAIASETAGRLRAALDLTVAYAKSREQFGQPIGSFQAIQHRLAQLHVAVESVTWLSRYAAWSQDDEVAATAATLACDTARWASVELHQLTGAIGFTEEYDLHLWTMPLQALRVELGGIGSHSRSLVATRWPGRASTLEAGVALG
jgi:alkylation response protein AidB-like acyl-CoA dehydrogenase